MPTFGAPHPQRQGDEEVPASFPRRLFRPRLMIPAILVIGLATFLRPPIQLAADNFAFYLPSGHHMIPFASSGGAKYLPVIQVLNMLGKVEGIQRALGEILRAGKGKGDCSAHSGRPSGGRQGQEDHEDAA